MTELVKYEAAKHALAQAKSVDEVKNIRDVSSAMKAYAKQAKDKQMEVDACEIRIRAERRLGEMIRDQKETVGLAQGKRTDLVPEGNQVNDRPTLSDVGIDKKLSSRSQAIANIPEEQFEETLSNHREQQQAVTAKTMDTLARQGKEHEKPMPELKPVSHAQQFATMAILQLKRITNDDPAAEAELDRVSEWIANKKGKLK